MPSRSDWSIPDGVTYLNHGSFGPAPKVVQDARAAWTRRLESQPMDFYLRQMEPALDHSMDCLSKLVGAESRDMVFVDNATVAMNIVAENIGLKAGDEVLLNDHEYGAVFRIWRRKCEQVGATVVSARLGQPPNDNRADGAAAIRFETSDDVVKPIFAAVTDRTKLIVVSHVTSPTAIIFPVAEICRQARALKVPVCIDGPHAIAMQSVNLREIDCDFYCASLHKWLSASCGSGFLYVKRKWQQTLQPHMTSWGRSLGGRSERWQDCLDWLGTRDPAPFLSVPTAIQFLAQAGFEEFRQRTHQLAQTARGKLERFFGEQALVPDSPQWYASMIAVPLPSSDYKKPKPNSMHPLQQQLWERFKIEAPIMECGGRFLLRVSCHLYTTSDDIEYLMDSLGKIRGWNDSKPED